MTLLITLIIAAITYGTPLLFGTLGEILTEKSGNLNLGVEGIMFMGGALGLGGVYYYEKLSSSPNGFVAILVGIFFAFRDLLRSGRYRPLPDKRLEHHRYLALAFRERWFQSYQQRESGFVIRGDCSGTGDRLRCELAVRLV